MSARAGKAIAGACLLAASAGLGFWYAAVHTACEKPYRDNLGDIISGTQACNLGSPHAGLAFGGFVLILLIAVAGLAGLAALVSALRTKPPKSPQQQRADFDRKVAETKARDAAREAAAQRQHQEKMQAAASELARSVAPIQLPRLGLAIHDGIIYVGGIRRDIRPLGSLTGSHATFTQLRDKPPKQHGLTYDIAIGLYSGPTPRGAVTVTAGSKTHHREVEGAMAVRQIHAEADRLNAFAEGAAWRGRAAQS
jgi:hypothetical protein